MVIYRRIVPMGIVLALSCDALAQDFPEFFGISNDSEIISREVTEDKVEEDKKKRGEDPSLVYEPMGLDLAMLSSSGSAPAPAIDLRLSYGHSSGGDSQGFEFRYGNAKKLQVEARYINFDLDFRPDTFGAYRFRVKRTLHDGSKLKFTGRVAYADKEDSYGEWSLGTAISFKNGIGPIEPEISIDAVRRNRDSDGSESALAATLAGAIYGSGNMRYAVEYDVEDNISDDDKGRLIVGKQWDASYGRMGSTTKWTFGVVWEERGLVIASIGAKF